MKVIHFLVFWAIVLLAVSAIQAQGTAPAGDLEQPDPNPTNPTILPAQVTIGFNGVVTQLARKPNGNHVPESWHQIRIELIHPTGFKMIHPDDPVAATAQHSPVSIVKVNNIHTFSGHCWKLGGGPWDAGVYTMELQIRYKTSSGGSWGPWQVIDRGKLTVAAGGGGGGPGGGINSP